MRDLSVVKFVISLTGIEFLYFCVRFLNDKNECNLEFVFDTLICVIIIFGGDGGVVLFFIVLFILFCQMFFYAILFDFGHIYFSFGFDEFSLIWYVASLML